MTQLPTTQQTRAHEALTLEELFNEAARYGEVGIFPSSREPHPNCYSVNITFRTKEHTEMKAKSAHLLPVKTALIQAIRNAEEMVALARSLSK